MIKVLTLPKRILTTLTEAGVFWAGMLSPVFAQTEIGEGAEAGQPTGAEENLFNPGGLFNRIVNTIIFLVGAIAVVMLIVGGIRYVVSAGSDEAVKGAKNTILYAIIGIVVALLAYAAVNFIIGQLEG